MLSADIEDFPAEEDGDLNWFIEAKDQDPASEQERQGLVLSGLTNQAPAVDVVAIPNAGKRSDWERLQRWREGARAGALDLVFSWQPTRENDRGVFFAEMKDGQKMPTKAQRERLNIYTRQGHACGVYRTAATLLDHLRQAGAPFL
jgi:hypothetical protein